MTKTFHHPIGETCQYIKHKKKLFIAVRLLRSFHSVLPCRFAILICITMLQIRGKYSGLRHETKRKLLCKL